MIFLTKGQVLRDNPGMVVYDPTGYYNDGDSVICASVGSPEEPVCRYEAKFIAYGGMVYSISDEDALMTEITKIDPASLFGKDGQQIAVDKMVEKIVPQESGEVVQDATTEAVDPDENETTVAEPAEEVEEPRVETTLPSESEVLLEDINSMSSSTPSVVIPEDISVEASPTTTPSEVTGAPVTSTPLIPDDTLEIVSSTESGQ